MDSTSFKNALYRIFGLNRHNQQTGEPQIMVKKENNENKILGFLMGLGAGAIVYAFLSLFDKPKCPICQTPIKKHITECPCCHSKLRWSDK